MALARVFGQSVAGEDAPVPPLGRSRERRIAFAVTPTVMPAALSPITGTEPSGGY